MNKDIGLLVAAGLIASASAAYAIKEKRRADRLIGDVRDIIDQYQEMSSLAKGLHYENLKQDNDMLAATIIWIDYKKDQDYLSELLGDDKPRKNMKSHERYTKGDLDELSCLFANDDIAYHEALRIVSLYLTSASIDIFKVTPMNCLYAYL